MHRKLLLMGLLSSLLVLSGCGSSDPPDGSGGSGGTGGSGGSGGTGGGGTGGTGGTDTTAPQVVSVTPADDESGVGREDTISITFNEAMDPNSLTATSVKLEGSFPVGEVPYTGDYMAETNTFVLMPNEPLTRLKGHSIAVTTDVTDAAGNHLDMEFTSRFATEDGSWAAAESIPEANAPGTGFIEGNVSLVVTPSADAMVVHWDGGNLYSNYYAGEEGNWQGRQQVGDTFVRGDFSATADPESSARIAVAYSADGVYTNTFGDGQWGSHRRVDIPCPPAPGHGDARSPKPYFNGSDLNVAYRAINLDDIIGQSENGYHVSGTGCPVKLGSGTVGALQLNYRGQSGGALRVAFSNGFVLRSAFPSDITDSPQLTAVSSLPFYEGGLAAASGFDRAVFAWGELGGSRLAYGSQRNSDFGGQINRVELDRVDGGGIADLNATMEFDTAFFAWSTLGTPKAYLWAFGGCNPTAGNVVELGAPKLEGTPVLLASEVATLCGRAVVMWTTGGNTILARRFNGFAYTPYGQDDPNRNQWLEVEELEVPFDGAVVRAVEYDPNGDILVVGTAYDAVFDRYFLWSARWH